MSVLVATLGFATFMFASQASHAQNPFPDGPPAVGACLEGCAKQLGACLESVGTGLEACVAGLERPEEVPMGIPQDVQVCLDATEIGQVGCRAQFDQCVDSCGAKGPPALN